MTAIEIILLLVAFGAFAVGAIILGQNAKLYYRSAGTFGSPTWTVIGIVKDVKVSNAAAAADATTRADAVMTYGRGQPDLELTFKVKKVLTDTGYIALRAAWTGGTDIDMWVADGDYTTVGNGGPRGNWIITNWGEDQANGTVIFNEVTCKPSANSTDAFELDKVA